jgi:hypothetical protein
MLPKKGEQIYLRNKEQAIKYINGCELLDKLYELDYVEVMSRNYNQIDFYVRWV